MLNCNIDTKHSKKHSKLLYVDPLSPNGHINFNRIFIEALNLTFKTIHFAFRENYSKNLNVDNMQKVYSIPGKYYKKRKNKIATRFALFRILQFIKNECNLNEYDYIIFASYEEISLYLSFIKKPLILINHNNISGLDNKIKLFFFKKIAKNNVNIIFENYMKEFLETKGVKNTYVIHHGIPPAYNSNILEDSSLREQYENIERYDNVIFCPSSSSVDKIFLNEIKSNQKFNKFLEINNILLIIKDNTNVKKMNNIFVINNYLSDIQYQYLFLKSNFILIPYPKTFSYRVSSVLFEAIANRKMCLLSNIQALNIYKKYFNYNPYFNDVDELIIRIKINILELNKKEYSPYNNITKLYPNILFLDNNSLIPATKKLKII